MYRLRGGARREDAVLKGISFSEGWKRWSRGGRYLSTQAGFVVHCLVWGLIASPCIYAISHFVNVSTKLGN
jgi:hypothetical protein